MDTYSGHNLGVVKVSTDALGQKAAIFSMDSHIRIRDLKTKSLIKDLDYGISECWTGAMSPDGEYLAIGTESGIVKYTNIQTGATVNLQDPNVKDFVMAVTIVCFSFSINRITQYLQTYLLIPSSRFSSHSIISPSYFLPFLFTLFILIFAYI